MRGAHFGNSVAVLVAAATAVTAAELPDRYFRLLEAGIAHVEKQVEAEPALDLKRLESRGDGWRLFPHVILAAAVLYAKQDPANRSYHEPRMLSLAMRIGDRLASDSEAGSFQERLNSDRDAYMWLESYRILESNLGGERRKRWRRELERNLAGLAADSAARIDFPGYNSPFNGTSPNHLSLWASTIHLAGKMFRNAEWEKIGASVMHRFAAKEQSADGYWGEHETALPTPGKSVV